jgi:antitoxin component YwqK of YwqJK toxin-antitoxin module
MMRLVFLISIFFFSVSHSKAQNVTDAKGLKQGEWSKVYPGTNVLQYKGQFKNNVPSGTFTYFYETGKTKAIIIHGDKALRSEAFFYYPSGKLMTYGIYRNQKKDSVWSNYNENEALVYTETFQNDVLNGKKSTYYLPDATQGKTKVIAIESNYLNGKLSGQFTEYFMNGTIKETGVYKDDAREGVWIKNNPNGSKMMEERFKKGITHGWQYAYDDTGKEIGKSYYYNGEKLEGKLLDAKLEYFKKNGIDPNQ